MGGTLRAQGAGDALLAAPAGPGVGAGSTRSEAWGGCNNDVWRERKRGESESDANNAQQQAAGQSEGAADKARAGARLLAVSLKTPLGMISIVATAATRPA